MNSAKPKKRILIFSLSALVALCAASLLLSKHGLSITRYELAFENLPADFDGFRIIQLSDLHGSEFGDDNSRLIEKVSEEKPDIIVLTGDFLDRGKTDVQLPQISSLVKALCELAPVYFISGNHDWDSGEIKTLAQVLKDSGARYLRNECVRIERGDQRIILAGVEDPNSLADMLKPDEVVDIIRGHYPNDFVVFLAHRNTWIEDYPELEVDIILSGHSHGGIVRLPFFGGVFDHGVSFFPEHDAGLFETEAYSLIVSRGLGNTAPVPRFMNTPEIISLTLRSKQA